MPRIDIAAAPASRGSDYPAPHDAAFAGRVRRRLGDAVGIEGFGVNHRVLAPGEASALRHWHEVEEEMVVVLAGEVVLEEEGGETTLRAGEVAGFPAGRADGHRIVNRSAAPATILEIGTRPVADRCHYPDAGMTGHTADGRRWFTRRDGTALTEDEA